MQNLLPAILLIEDDQPTRELYRRELSRHYQVLACENQSEALDLLHTHPVCAIILEPASRDGQGWALLAQLRTVSQIRSIPIILCSTQDERHRIEQAATRYLIKPVLPAALREVIGQVIQSSTRANLIEEKE